MSDSIYTLLVVESPVLARLIQQVAPSSVFVMSTGGYCWHPEYDLKQNRLKAVANPEQAAFRKELKEQAAWAGNIVVATDTDPSGDFIAWCLGRFLKTMMIKRGKIRHISKSGIIQMLSETTELNDTYLENRLKNRHMIRSVWHRLPTLPDPELAAIAAAFSTRLPFSTFADETGTIYKSSQPVTASPDEWFPVSPDSSLNEFRNYKPLSTFDIIESAVQADIASSYSEAENLLYALFQHRLNLSDQSLISYPRTDANAFYPETWEGLHTQFLASGIKSSFKPSFLRETANPDIPHESVYPLQLDLDPDDAAGRMDSQKGELYRLIHSHTLRACSMPEPLQSPLVNDLLGDGFFYTEGKENGAARHSLRPICTVSDFGKRLNSLDAMTPSVFGTRLHEWLDKKYITINGQQVLPGKKCLPLLNRSEHFLQMLQNLQKAREENLDPETVKRILTS
ncbi:MAG: toprim domain-containing protein [Balneolaceae bacterium]|nr:toprim domain-containing protein [Balneolaceae bacterium]